MNFLYSYSVCSLALTIAVCSCAFSQNPNQFILNINSQDIGESVNFRNDSIIVIAGYTRQNNNYDICLITFNIISNTVLNVKILGSSNTEIVKFSAITSDEGLIVTGYTNGFGAGNNDIFLLKLDENLNVEWFKTYGLSFTEFAFYANSTSDGGYLITGKTNSVINSNQQLVLIKTDSEGNVVWSKIFGGSASEDGLHWAELSDGSYLIVGNTESFGEGLQDIYLIKVNSTGEKIWTRAYGSEEMDYGEAVLVNQNEIYIVGRTTSGHGDVAIQIIKINTNGEVIWSKKIAGNSQIQAEFGHLSNDGSVIVVGYTDSFGVSNSDAYVVKISSTGQLLWSKTIGTNDGEVLKHITFFNNKYVSTGYHINSENDNNIYFMLNDSSFEFSCGSQNVISIIDSNPPYEDIPNDSALSWNCNVNTYQISEISSSADITKICLIDITHEAFIETIPILISPNPFTHHTTLQITQSLTNATLTLHTTLGQKLREEKIQGTEFILQRNALAAGIYFLTVFENNHAIYKSKLIIE